MRRHHDGDDYTDFGGGFGGISAANSLRRLLPTEHGAVVIDKVSHFYVGAGNT